MSTPKGFIESLYGEHAELVTYLQQKGEISFLQNVEATLSKVLLLSSASYFESRISAAIAGFAANVSQNHEALVALVKNKAIERQYHTYFGWREGNRSAMPFFSMFGSSLKDAAKIDLKNAALKEAADAFLELGDQRNLLVHENFANYPMSKTAAEIFTLYSKAVPFVNYIESKLNPTHQVGTANAA